MTRVATILYIGALLVGLSTGGFISCRRTTSDLDASYQARQLTAHGVLREFSYAQYKYADSEHAKAALLTYVGLLEQMQKLRPEKAQRYDLATAYTRLALLEDAAHNPEQSQIYMARTRSWYKSAGGPELTDSQMKFAVEKIDAWMQ
jgi:hypothetical protein